MRSYLSLDIGLIAIGFVVGAGTIGIALAESQDSNRKADVPLGSSDCRPSPDRPAGWRGDWTGRYPGATPPLEWNIGPDGTGTNVRWCTQLPAFAGGSGASQPIAFGGRAYFCVGQKDATRGIQDLYCVSLTDGKIVWIKPLTFYDGASPEERKQVETTVAPLLQELDKLTQSLVETLNAKKLDQNDWRNNVCGKRIQVGTAINDALIAVNPKKYQVPGRHDWGFASATPCSDGKALYVWFASRMGACVSLSGERVWATFAPDSVKNTGEHGSHGSPVLLPDRFVVVYGSMVQAFDKKTGAILWQREADYAWGLPSSSLVSARVGNDTVLLLAHGQALRADTGEPAWSKFGGYQGENTTPACEDGTLYTFERSGIRSFALPATVTAGAKLTAAGSLIYTNIFAEYQIASPLYFDGLLYCVTDKALLRVFDPAAGQIVYDGKLPLRIVQNSWVGSPVLSASPTLGGNRIYVVDTAGAVAVVQPGRAFKLLAHNECTAKDAFVVNPVFIGNLMLLRGQSALYAVGQP